LKFAVLLVYFPSYLGQETAKWLLWSSSQAAICYYQSNHSKIRSNLVKCLAQGHNKRTCDLSH